MKKQLVLLTCFIFICVTTFGQTDSFGKQIDEVLNVEYRAGYAILNNGDTLNGDFQFNDCQQNYKEVVFRDTETLKKSGYDIKNIKFLSFFDQTFVPIESKDGWVLMRVLVNDYVKLYLHKHFYATINQSKFSNHFYCIKPNGEKLIVTNDPEYPFKSRASNFFEDDWNLCQKINTGKYTKKNLLDIVLEYNLWVKKKEEIKLQKRQ